MKTPAHDRLWDFQDAICEVELKLMLSKDDDEKQKLRSKLDDMRVKEKELWRLTQTGRQYV
jgi:hypothetical protein|tara:strand:+ start:923 stop:1105 length:183 start_codon:yes stop_codon:yes gene_type:complete